jgi:hypothetical protein
MNAEEKKLLLLLATTLRQHLVESYQFVPSPPTAESHSVPVQALDKAIAELHAIKPVRK